MKEEGESCEERGRHGVKRGGKGVEGAEERWDEG